jgi:hypothetical protein
MDSLESLLRFNNNENEEITWRVFVKLNIGRWIRVPCSYLARKKTKTGRALVCAPGLGLHKKLLSAERDRHGLQFGAWGFD